MCKKWFVVYCKSGKDRVVEQHLISQSVETYRPKLEFSSKGNFTQSQRKCDSLFPRYIFVRVDYQKQPLAKIAYTRGVVGFVKFGDRYSNVEDSVIERIKICEKNQGEYSEYNKGDIVRIHGGGFTELEAVFLESCGDSRAFVLMDLLGGKRKMAVPQRYLSKTSG